MDMISPEASQIHAKIMVELSNLFPELSHAGQELLEQVSTPNWTLEWGMLEWVSEQFSFPAALREELFIAGISLLAYVRVLDNLADEEQKPRQSIVLSSALQHIGIQQCIHLFSRNLPNQQALVRFWGYFDCCMGEWLRATLNRRGDGFPLFQNYSRGDFKRLAGRGAMLKLCPAAACLLAKQAELIAPLMAAIDYLMVSVVMLDEQFDWANDLEAGRYNVFVAYCSDLPQTEPNRAENHRLVLKEIYLHQSAHSYFNILYTFLQDARQQAVKADCTGLVEYLDWYEEEVHHCRARFTEMAQVQIQQMAERYIEVGQFESTKQSI